MTREELIESGVVMTTFRFLSAYRKLSLINTEAYIHATMRNRVAIMVIKRAQLLESKHDSVLR